MRTLKFLLRKEFRLLLRNKQLFGFLVFVPILQLIIFPMAANFTIKNVNIAFVDHDHSQLSKQLFDKILSSGYFRLAGNFNDYQSAYASIESDKADLLIEIPPNFEDHLMRDGGVQLYIAANAINGIKGLLGTQYLGSVVNDFNNQIRSQTYVQGSSYSPIPTIEMVADNWYNPHLLYYMLMVPGILVNLLTAVSNMSSLNIVKEKEAGTIEQLNVTPVKKYQFILSKLIPFWTLGVIIFSVGLIVAWLIYGIVPLGSIWLLYVFALVYLFTMVGFGLLISTYSDTQMQALSLSFLFLMIFNLMSGLFTPIDSMPVWAKMITKFIPVSYFIEVNRMIILKGSRFADVSFHLLVLSVMGILITSWAVANYRKTT